MEIVIGTGETKTIEVGSVIELMPGCMDPFYDGKAFTVTKIEGGLPFVFLPHPMGAVEPKESALSHDRIGGVLWVS